MPENTSPEYGQKELQTLVEFNGKEAAVEFGGTTYMYTSSPLVDGKEIIAEWRVFKRALSKEKKAVIEKKKLTNPSTLQDVKAEMEGSDA